MSVLDKLFRIDQRALKKLEKGSQGFRLWRRNEKTFWWRIKSQDSIF